MQVMNLSLIEGHLFAEIDGGDWIVDTGAPSSFGNSPELVIDGKRFDVQPDYLGLNAAQLSELLEHPTVGLLGADVINEFDSIFDVPRGKLTMSSVELSVEGESIKVDDFMGIPVIEVSIAGRTWSMFFDTGAKISYFQDESIGGFPLTGEITDFFPGFGQFQTKTHLVDLIIGGSSYSFQCGSLPGLLGLTLSLADTNGIVGNQLVLDRSTGYFPRRKRITLGRR